jgi:hypothetical protein
MPTLMTFGNSEGERRCDSKCYDAKDDKCTCCCGGKNHGVGLQQAMKNNQAMALDMVEKTRGKAARRKLEGQISLQGDLLSQ